MNSSHVGERDYPLTLIAEWKAEADRLRRENRRLRAWVLYIGGMADAAGERGRGPHLLKTMDLIRGAFRAALRGRAAPRTKSGVKP